MVHCKTAKIENYIIDIVYTLATKRSIFIFENYYTEIGLFDWTHFWGFFFFLKIEKIQQVSRSKGKKNWQQWVMKIKTSLETSMYYHHCVAWSKLILHIRARSADNCKRELTPFTIRMWVWAINLIYSNLTYSGMSCVLTMRNMFEMMSSGE